MPVCCECLVERAEGGRHLAVFFVLAVVFAVMAAFVMAVMLTVVMPVVMAVFFAAVVMMLVLVVTMLAARMAFVAGFFRAAAARDEDEARDQDQGLFERFHEFLRLAVEHIRTTLTRRDHGGMFVAFVLSRGDVMTRHQLLFRRE